MAVRYYNSYYVTDRANSYVTGNTCPTPMPPGITCSSYYDERLKKTQIVCKWRHLKAFSPDCKDAFQKLGAEMRKAGNAPGYQSQQSVRGNKVMEPPKPDSTAKNYNLTRAQQQELGSSKGNSKVEVKTPTKDDLPSPDRVEEKKGDDKIMVFVGIAAAVGALFFIMSMIR